MMRRRSSSRGSRKLMPVISSEPRFWAFSSTGLGIGARHFRDGRRRVGGQRWGFGSRGFNQTRPGYERQGSAGNRFHGRNADGVEELFGRNNLAGVLNRIYGDDVANRLLGALFQFDVHHLGFELVFELIAGLLELAQYLAQLSSQSGKLLGPKDDESQQKDEDHLWHAEIHIALIIIGRIAGGKRGKSSPRRTRRTRRRLSSKARSTTEGTERTEGLVSLFRGPGAPLIPKRILSDPMRKDPHKQRRLRVRGGDRIQG